MDSSDNPSLLKRMRKLVIGRAQDPHDPNVFHKLSLIAFFAWIGLGADGLSSSSYGPEEAFRALGEHGELAIFVAIATAITVIIISAGYCQIIELFPSGGGGYVVASKLLSPKCGMVAGCALLVDYILTIAISIASGADAVFSFLPPEWLPYKLSFAVVGVILLMVLNMRGVKESVVPLVPIFLVFIATHAFAIIYAIFMHAGNVPAVAAETANTVRTVTSEVGVFGLFMLLLRSYGMGAGTYTGIEAVSNGLPILRDPKVVTGKRTMKYMAASLAIVVLGLMTSYILFHAVPTEGKTLNAVLFENMVNTWNNNIGKTFLLITLVSEAALLFVAAQTGFLGGPRVLANMAMDRWFPTKFAMLSDRLVTQNGVILMGGAALIIMILTKGKVQFLVVLYSINVFITFVLSQLGMVRHWWIERRGGNKWLGKMSINFISLTFSLGILISMAVIKFHEGGYITILVTGALVVLTLVIHRHYDKTHKMLKRLDTLVAAATMEMEEELSLDSQNQPIYDPKGNTAVLLVNGFNGLGLHTLFGIIRLFRGVFKNFVFLQVGVVDAGTFKGSEEISALRKKIDKDANRYVDYMQRHGYFAEGFTSVGTDIVDEVLTLAPKVLEKFNQPVFFGGQIVFPEDFVLSRWLHNYVVFAVQRQFYHRGVPFVILPIRV